MTSHKWANEIKAWADGAEIQYRIRPRVEGGEYSEWVTQKNPQWYTSDVAEYRVKPEPVKEVLNDSQNAGCEHCTDPDGALCLPQAGLAPHTQTDVGITTGWIPAQRWPAGFFPGADNPTHGTYYCETCGTGLEEVTADDRKIKDLWCAVDSMLEDLSGTVPANARYAIRKVIEEGVQAAVHIGETRANH